MHRLFTSFFLALALLSFGVEKVSAQSYIGAQLQVFAGPQGSGYDIPTDPRILVARWVGRGLTLMATLFLAYTIYAAIIITTAAGDDEKITKGKSTLRTGIIGIIITISAYSITVLVSNAILRSTKPESDDFFNRDLERGMETGPREMNRDPMNISRDPVFR